MHKGGPIRLLTSVPSLGARDSPLTGIRQEFMERAGERVLSLIEWRPLPMNRLRAPPWRRFCVKSEARHLHEVTRSIRRTPRFSISLCKQ
jgi:hypothetical protein